MNFKNKSVVFNHEPDINEYKDIIDDLVDRHSCDERIAYKQYNGEDLYLGYYFPKDYDPQNRKYPVIFAIHGGSWASRGIMNGQDTWSGDHLGFIARHFADMGFLAVVTTYRLLKGTYPQNDDLQLFDLYADVKDAMNYVADNASAYGADLNNVTIMGESAGGHLAAAMATNSFYENRLPIHSTILVNPITFLFNDFWGEGTPEKSNRPIFNGMGKRGINMLLSPLFNISENTPKALLLHGASDTLVSPEHSILYNQRMTQFGNESELHFINGANHAFLLKEYYGELSHTLTAIKIIDEYLQKNVLKLN